jgi:hypothetical protein
MKRTFNEGGEVGILRDLQVFSRGLSERPEVYGVSSADAAEALRLVEALAQAFVVCSSPATRTPLAVVAKREAMAAARPFCLRLLRFIQLNPSVSEADRVAIGVPPAAEKRRVPAPTTTPMLGILGIVPGGHEIEVADSAQPDRRGKPVDVRGLELIVAYSPHVGGTTDGLTREQIIKSGKPHGVVTRGRAAVIHAEDRVGSVANYLGRWVNRRGEAGPWSQPVRMMLAMPAEARRNAAA